jgi:hypothetical protein
MLSQIIWVSGTGAALAIVIRAVAGGWYRKCPVFLAYIGWAGISSVVGYCVFHWWLPLYSVYYWSAEFVGLMLGFGVTWELSDRILRPYPAIRRAASFLLSLVLVVTLFNAILNQFESSSGRYEITTLDVECYFRIAQAILMAALTLVLYHYRIPLGRGLGSVFFGFGFYIAVSVIGLAARSHFGGQIQHYWQLAQQCSYAAVSVIWLRGLWRPEASPPGESAQEPAEYSIVYLKTARMLSDMRSSLLWLTR